MTRHDHDTTIHNLTLGHCNIQGGFLNLGKTTKITDLIRNYELDILSINELNLNDTIDSNTLNVPSSFHLLRLDRPNSSRGGCGIVINKKVEYKELEINHDMVKLKPVLFFFRANFCKFSTKKIFSGRKDVYD